MLLAILLVSLATLAISCSRWWLERSQPPQDDGPDAVIRAAYEACGLPLEQFGAAFDLAASGKLHEVLHHAALIRGEPHPLRTVGDVQRFYLSRGHGPNR